jgi:hypothetical protein
MRSSSNDRIFTSERSSAASLSLLVCSDRKLPIASSKRRCTRRHVITRHDSHSSSITSHHPTPSTCSSVACCVARIASACAESRASLAAIESLCDMSAHATLTRSTSSSVLRRMYLGKRRRSHDGAERLLLS